MVMYIQYSANCKRGLSSILKDSYFKKGLQMFFQMFEILETVTLGSTVGSHSILRYHNDFWMFLLIGKIMEHRTCQYFGVCEVWDDNVISSHLIKITSSWKTLLWQAETLVFLLNFVFLTWPHHPDSFLSPLTCIYVCMCPGDLSLPVTTTTVGLSFSIVAIFNCSIPIIAISKWLLYFACFMNKLANSNNSCTCTQQIEMLKRLLHIKKM